MKNVLYLLVVVLLLCSGCAGLKVTVLVPGDERARDEVQQEYGPLPEGSLLAIR